MQKFKPMDGKKDSLKVDVGVVFRRLMQILRASRTLYGQKVTTPKQLFQAIDKDNSGILSKKELITSFERLDLGLTHQQIHALLECVDANSSDDIVLEEWLLFFKRWTFKEETAEKVRQQRRRLSRDIARTKKSSEKARSEINQLLDQSATVEKESTALSVNNANNSKKDHDQEQLVPGSTSSVVESSSVVRDDDRVTNVTNRRGTILLASQVPLHATTTTGAGTGDRGHSEEQFSTSIRRGTYFGSFPSQSHKVLTMPTLDAQQPDQRRGTMLEATPVPVDANKPPKTESSMAGKGRNNHLQRQEEDTHLPPENTEHTENAKDAKDAKDAKEPKLMAAHRSRDTMNAAMFTPLVDQKKEYQVEVPGAVTLDTMMAALKTIEEDAKKDERRTNSTGLVRGVCRVSSYYIVLVVTLCMYMYMPIKMLLFPPMNCGGRSMCWYVKVDARANYTASGHIGKRIDLPLLSTSTSAMNQHPGLRSGGGKKSAGNGLKKRKEKERKNQKE